MNVRCTSFGQIDYFASWCLSPKNYLGPLTVPGVGLATQCLGMVAPDPKPSVTPFNLLIFSSVGTQYRTDNGSLLDFLLLFRRIVLNLRYKMTSRQASVRKTKVHKFTWRRTTPPGFRRATDETQGPRRSATVCVETVHSVRGSLLRNRNN